MTTDRKSPEYREKKRLKYQENREKILQKLAHDHLCNPRKYMLKDAKKRAKRDNLDFNIVLEDIMIPEYCPISLLKLESSKGNMTPSSPTLDRIDNSKGYVKGNVAVISNRANSMKRDANYDEICRMLNYMRLNAKS